MNLKTFWDWLHCRSGVPAEYRDLYRKLDWRLTDFEQAIASRWNGAKAGTVFSSELLSANGNRGTRLLEPQTQLEFSLELDALQAMGCGAVSIALNFPIVYQEFHDWNNTPGDCQRFIDLYRDLVADIHRRGMKAIIDNAVVFTGYYSAESGWNVNGYYRTIEDGRELAGARAQTALTIAKRICPDYLNLGSEPDTQAEILGEPWLKQPYHYAELIGSITAVLRAADVTIPLGAGCGTWSADAEAFVTWLSKAGIDTIDFHLYPVNFSFLERLPGLASLARSLGKRVAIGEAWLLKQRAAEFSTENAASNPVIFSRDAFSFWAPLDQKFLCALVNFAHWQQLTYFSGFWDRYFWAYLEYGDCTGMSADEITAAACKAAGDALARGQTTATAAAYKEAIAPGVTQ